MFSPTNRINLPFEHLIQFILKQYNSAVDKLGYFRSYSRKYFNICTLKQLSIFTFQPEVYHNEKIEHQMHDASLHIY